MGYYTQYKLKINLTEKPFWMEEHILEEIGKISNYGSHLFEMGECKWYDHHEHMTTISLRYPEILFELSGEGEEAGDLWRKYYLNGKSQRCNSIISYEPLDLEKLKS